MATIGSITVAFGADLRGLSEGIDSIAGMFDRVSEKAERLAEQLDSITSKSVSLKVSVESSEVEKAKSQIEGIPVNSAKNVSITADSSLVEEASGAVDELGTSITATSQAASGGRGPLASLLVTSARLTSVALSGASAYAKLREATVQNIDAITGLGSTQKSLAVIQEALRGNGTAIKVVIQATTQAVRDYAKSFLTVEGAQQSLQSAVLATARAFGISDEAVVKSIGFFSQFATNQIATAGVFRISQRASDLLAKGYESLAVSAAKYFTGSDKAVAAGKSIADTLKSLSADVKFLNRDFDAAVSAIAKFSQNFNIVGRVSATVGAAFDKAASLVSSFASSVASSKTASDVINAISAAIGSLSAAAKSAVPAIAATMKSIATGVAPAAGLVGSLSLLANVFSVVSAASGETAAGFFRVAAGAVAQTAAAGAVGGAITAAAAGASVMAGAAAGAATAVGGLASIFPVTTALAVATAVATGRVAHALQHVGDNAEMMGNLADRFGQPVQEIEKLKIAAEQSGVALNSVVRAQQVFSQNVSKIKIGNLGVEQTREASAAMKQLGISAEELRSKKPEDLFIDVAREISKLPDATKKTQVAMDLFGRTGPQILPLLKNLEQVNEDIGRLGGTISDLDFERFLAVDQSFDRLTTASGAMTDDLVIPFTRMQEAWNNASAEVIGGLAPLVGAVGEVIADLSTPLAVIVEVTGRVLGIFARVAAAVAKIVTAFLPVASTAILFELLGDAINAVLKPVEFLVDTMEGFASTVEEFMRPTVEGFLRIGEAATELLNVFTDLLGLGDIFGETTASLLALGFAYLAVTSSSQIFSAVMATSAGTAIASAATTAAAWVAAGAAIAAAIVGAAVVAIGVYVASVIAATATTIASCAAMHVAWLFGLGPLGALIAGVELLSVGVVALYAFGGSIVDFFSGWGDGAKEIDGATASVEELTAAVEENQNKGLAKDAKAVADALAPPGDSSGTAQVNFGDGARDVQVQFGWAREAVVRFGMSFGVSEEQARAWAASVAAEAAGVAESLKGPSKEEIMSGISSARDEMAELSIRAAKFGQAGADAASKSTEEFNELQRQLGSGAINIEEFNEGAAGIAESLSKGLDEIAKSSPEETLKRNLELFKQLDDSVKSAEKSFRDLTAVRMVGDDLLPASDEVKRRAAELQAEYSSAIEAIKKKQAAGGFQSELDQRRSKAEEDLESGKIDSIGYSVIMAELDSTNAQEEANKAVEEVNRELDRKRATLKADISFADDIRKQLDTAFLSPVQKFEKELKKIKDNPQLSDMDKLLAETNLRKEARESLVGKSAQTQLQERSRDVAQAAEAGLINADELNAGLKKAAEDFASAVGVTKTPFETFSSSLDNIAKQFGFAGQPIDVVREKLKGNAEQLALFDRAVQESRDNLLASLGIEKTPQQVFDEQIEKINEAVNATDPNKRITQEQADQATAVATRKRDSALGAGEDLGGQFRDRQAKIDEAFGGGKDPAKLAVAQNKLDMDRRSAAGLEATPAQAMKAGIDKVNDAFGVTGKSMAEIQATLSPAAFEEYQEAIKKNKTAIEESLGVQKPSIVRLQEAQDRLADAVGENVISQEQAGSAARKLRDDFMSSLGVAKTPFEEFSGALDNIADQFDMAGQPLDAVREKLKGNADQLALFDRAVKTARDNLLSSLGIEKTPQQVFEEQMKKIEEAVASTDPNKQITKEQAEQARTNATRKRDEALGGESAADFGGRIKEQRAKIEEAYGKDGANDPEKFKSAMKKLNESIPGAEQQSPVQKFQEDLEKLKATFGEGTPEFEQNKKNLQAQLQEDLAPALDATKADRRGIEGSDARSKGGVDTFFRILRGNDNPSLKAQLDIARNTRILAEAAKNPDAAPVIAQLSAPR
jgi:hypothetical protein